MRYIIPFCLACLLLQTSCTRYQIYSFASDDLPKVAKKGYLQEQKNDSLNIYYYWNKETNQPVVAVENLSQSMAYIDWEHSTLIVNEIKQDVFQEIERIEKVKRPKSKARTIQKTPRKTQKLSVAKSYETIFPHSTSQYFLPKIQIGFSPTSSQTFTRTQVKGLGELQIRNFDKNNTPLKTRIFLTYQVGKAGKPQTTEREFWIHQVVNTRNDNLLTFLTNDFEIPEVDKNGFNKVMIRNRNSFGRFLRIVVLPIGAFTAFGIFISQIDGK